MILFSEDTPYPLLPLDSYSYKEAQDHSAFVDAWLGFHLEQTEEKVRAQAKDIHSNEHQNWEHLSVQAMQTPYVEIRNILDLLQLTPGAHVVDLGCAYGRMGFVLGAHHQDIHFRGYELENERVLEVSRILATKNYPNIKVFTADLSSSEFSMPVADVYFIFDYGNEAAVRKTLQDLQVIAQKKAIEVVARGRLSRFLIHKENPWLAEVNSPRHFSHFSIYKS